MNVATGQVIAEPIGRNNSATFIRFLCLIDRCTDPALSIHLIMDNGSSHTSRATRAWLAAHPWFAVTSPKRFLAQHDRATAQCADPPPAPPRRLRLPRRPGSTDHRLHRPYNRTARPYRWRYDADAERARYPERRTQHSRHPDAFDRAA